MFADAIWDDGWPKEGDHTPTDLYNGLMDPLEGTDNMGRFAIARHGGITKIPTALPAGTKTLVGKINMAFVEGHVESVKIDNLWSYYWHANWTGVSHPPVQ
jgi:hypothetical protein